MAGKRCSDRFASNPASILATILACISGGNNTLVRVEVHWPSGLVESFKHPPIDQPVILREGIGHVANRRPVKDVNQEA
jgi:hypothetical protein